MIWSRRAMPIISPEAVTLSVTSTSQPLGVGSPLGWLWMRTTPRACFRKASTKISRGVTSVAFAVPLVIRRVPSHYFLPERLSHLMAIQFKRTDMNLVTRIFISIRIHRLTSHPKRPRRQFHHILLQFTGSWLTGSKEYKSNKWTPYRHPFIKQSEKHQLYRFLKSVPAPYPMLYASSEDMLLKDPQPDTPIIVAARMTAINIFFIFYRLK